MRDDEPKYRGNLVYVRPPEHIASELEDLADDQYFYEQIEKNRPSENDDEEEEHAHNRRPNVDREVAFLHGSGKKRRKNRPQDHNGKIIVRDEDVYGDYGEMVLPHRDVEMHDTYERNTHESGLHDPSSYTYEVDYGKPSRKHRPKCNVDCALKKNKLTIDASVYNQPKKRPNARPNVRPLARPNARPNPLDQPHTYPGTVFVHRPKTKKKFEKIMVTKKLEGPEELHAEIDKIFERKSKNYNKPGHGKHHWELRIIPQRYDELEEYSIN